LPYSIEHIATSLNAKAAIRIPAQIDHLLTDSRRLLYPNATLFFAITTLQNDGHLYIPDLIQRGVTNFVVQPTYDTSQFLQCNFIIVEDVLAALQMLAAQHRAAFTYPVIGITGSNGKTIVKEWLYQLLANHYSIIRSPRSYNSQIGVPLSVWEMTDQHQLGIFEAGISQKGEMQSLANIIQPTIGILTSIGTAHEEGFEDEQQKIKEKRLLFSKAPCVIAPWEAIQGLHTNNQTLLTWSRSHTATFKVQSETIINAQTHLMATYQETSLEFIIPFTDIISVNNVITCLLTLLHLKIPIQEIQKGISQLKHLDMRMQIKKGIQNCYILNDSYSNDIHSLKLALEYATQQAGQLPITLILSDLIQLQPTTIDYDPLIKQLVAFPIKKIIAIGNTLAKALNETEALKPLGIKLQYFETTQQFLNEMDIHSFRKNLF